MCCVRVPITVLENTCMPGYLNHQGLSGLGLYERVKLEIRAIGHPRPISVEDSNKGEVMQTRALFFQCGLTNSC